MEWIPCIKAEDNTPSYSPRRAATWFGYGDSDAQEMKKYRDAGDSFMGIRERKPTDRDPVQVKVKGKIKDSAGRDQEGEKFYLLYHEEKKDRLRKRPVLLGSKPFVWGHLGGTSTAMPEKVDAGEAAKAFLEYGTKQGRREGAVAGAITTAGLTALGALGYYGARWAYNKYMVKQFKHVVIAINYAEKASKALATQIDRASLDKYSTVDDKQMLLIYGAKNRECTAAYEEMRKSIEEHNKKSNVSISDKHKSEGAL